MSGSVPADAIIFNRNGMQVAVVMEGKAEIRKVGVKRDLGTQLEVDSGVKAGDQVILNPPVNLRQRQQGSASCRGRGSIRQIVLPVTGNREPTVNVQNQRPKPG